MLKKLIILVLAIVLLMPATGFCQRDEPDSSIDPQPFIDADGLIYGSYLKIIAWTMENGSFSFYKQSRMKYIRLVEVFDSPYTFCSTEVKLPKVRKVYFQVIGKAKTQNPTKEDDIELFARIVEVVMEHVDGDVKYTYYVGADKTLSGLPNEIKEWVSIKTLKGEKIRKTAIKGEELPPEAEIVDMKWGYWLAEFIKLYHLNLMESGSKFGPGPKLRDVILEELYDKESAGRFRHSSTPIDQPLLWAGIDYP